MLPASSLSMHSSTPITQGSSNGELVATDGSILPLERTHLEAHAWDVAASSPHRISDEPGQGARYGPAGTYAIYV